MWWIVEVLRHEHEKSRVALFLAGTVPYAVTLMAMLGKRSLSSPERLLKYWNEIDGYALQGSRWYGPFP